MAGRNRTDYELLQMIANLPVGVRSQMYEILQEMANGSTQRAFSASSLNGITLSATELGYLDGLTPGTAVASKALVTSPNIDVTGLRKVGLEKVIIATATANASAGAATITGTAGKVTSEDLTTAAQSEYTLTITNTSVAAADRVFASVANGTNSQGTPLITTIVPSANTITLKVKNDHASQAFNGKIVVSFFVIPVT